MASLSTRKFYLDNLRSFLVILVVVHHAGQAYGPGGAWPVIDGEPVRWLGTFFSINAAFFMGLFFLISGYVMPGAYEKYGTAGFIRSKIMRLLIPLAAVSLGIFLPINYYMGYYSSFTAYVKYLGTADGVQSIIAHLWFVQHLLIYSALFAAVMWIVRKIRPRSPENKARDGLNSSVVYTAAAAVWIGVALLSYAVRMSYPIDRWLVVLHGVRLEPAHMPQYTVFFLTGVIAGQTGLLERIRSSDGKIFCAAGVIGVMIRILCGSIFGSLSPEMFQLVYACIETFIAVTVSAGLIVLFRDVMNRSTPVLRFFSDNAYGVYLYHVFPMVGIQMAIAGSHVSGELKFIGVAMASFAASYTAIYLVRKIKAVRRCV